MAVTYEPIANITLSSASTNVEFTSIPGTYTDLILAIYARVNVGGYSDYMQFNADTASNYSCTILWGRGTVAPSTEYGSTRYSSTSTAYVNWYGYLPAETNTFGTQLIHINNYANTNTNKTYICRPGNSAGGTDAVVGLWRSTAAITSLKYINGSSTYQSGSTFTLYGIKAA